MPIKVPHSLPAASVLSRENIFVMTEKRALRQDIRPLKILIVNIMPTKEVTETQLLRLIGNTPLQIEPEFLRMSTHKDKHTDHAHLESFYITFDEVKKRKYDGMILTGAPVETLPFAEVDYWDELCEILEWAKSNVYSSYFICWGAQAALYYYYGIDKKMLPKKLSGIYSHRVNPKKKTRKILRGFDDVFYVPHSRHTTVLKEDIEKTEGLDILAESKEAGVYLAAAKDGSKIFATGHSEYDLMTLDAEYKRDVAKGLSPEIPQNYYPADNPAKTPVNTWRAHANLIFSNWLNYYVYQTTPYDINKINE